MPTAAIVFAAPPPPFSAAPVTVGGLGIVTRQVRQARAAGANPVVVVGDVAVDGATGVASAAALAGRFDPAGDVLVFDMGVVLDARIVAAVMATPAPAIATARAGTIAGTERLDAAVVAAGVALYPASLVAGVVAGLGDWDLAATLRRTALPDANLVDVVATTGGTPCVWALPDDAVAAAATTEQVLAAALARDDAGSLRTLYAPARRVVVATLARLPVPAIAVRAAVVGFAILATLAFARGWLWPALVLALAYGLLDGVDRTLARVRVEVPGAPIRLPVDLAWYVAVAWHFAATAGVVPALATAILAGFAIADMRQDAAFARLSGTAFSEAGAVERRLRLFGANRDTRLWLWVPFAAAGAWLPGLAALAAYTAATFFVAQSRIFARLGERLTAR